SRHSSSDHSSLDLPSTSVGPSRKRRRSPMISVPTLPPVSGALSPVRADLIPPPKRVRDIGYLADIEVDPRETRVERVTHSAMPEDIPEPAQDGATETDTTVIPTEAPIIEPTIPPSPDYTLASPNYSLASETESDPSEDPSSGHIPPLPAVSPFLSLDDDTTDSDTPDTPPSPTHD
nr:hypothetical protein [Tanacetum cinerariifolium]